MCRGERSLRGDTEKTSELREQFSRNVHPLLSEHGGVDAQPFKKSGENFREKRDVPFRFQVPQHAEQQRTNIRSNGESEFAFSAIVSAAIVTPGLALPNCDSPVSCDIGFFHGSANCQKEEVQTRLVSVVDRTAASEAAGSGSIPGRATQFSMSPECGGFARDPAKVEDQVRLLARTLFGREARAERQGKTKSVPVRSSPFQHEIDARWPGSCLQSSLQ